MIRTSDYLSHKRHVFDDQSFWPFQEQHHSLSLEMCYAEMSSRALFISTSFSVNYTLTNYIINIAVVQGNKIAESDLMVLFGGLCAKERRFLITRKKRAKLSF